MAHFRKIGSWERAGYDEGSSLQILPTGQKTIFYLIAGADCVVSVDDESVAKVTAGGGDDKAAHADTSLTAWERAQVIRKVTVQAMNKVGDTAMRALLNGQDFAQPIGIRAVPDQNWRQVGKGLGECSPDLRESLQAMSLREAVIRVAEDQMQSAISCRSNGFGVYNIDAQYDWCGAFAYWCWAQAAFIHGDVNPIGSRSSVLWSPQRAIDWAMEPTSSGQLLRYKGPSPMTGKGNQEFRDLGWNGYELEAGDIVLVREHDAGGWKHVALVEQADQSTVYSIDGNQGMPQSIRRRERSLTELLPDKSHKLVFTHVLI
jgi:hypothetical protein